MFTLTEFHSRMEQYFKTKVVSKYQKITKGELQRRGVILYGAAVYGKYACNSLNELGIRVAWFVDKDENLVGTDYNGVPIRSLDSLRETDGRFVILCSTHIKNMIGICNSYGVDDWLLSFAISDWLWINDFGITNQLDIIPQGVFDGFAMLADDKSRIIYDRYFRWHFLYDNNFSDVCDPVMYFPEDLAGVIDYSNFCDVGAFYGDVLMNWISYLERENCHYTAIELDKYSYKRLISYVNSLPFKDKITTLNCAIGEKAGRVPISSSIGEESMRVLSKSDADGESIEVLRIDDLFADKPVSIIKADLEGHEMALLRGAEKTIRTQRPTLAISVYHRFADIWELPMWVKQLDLGYDFYLRHFPKVFTDTVMFAVPRK